MTSPTSRLVGTWGARTADELVRAMHGPGAAVCDVVEIRFDLPDDAAHRVADLVTACPKTVLATCRRASDGGGFRGSEDERIAVLESAVAAGAKWVDLEDDVSDAHVARLAAAGAKLLRSRHVDRLGDDAESIASSLLALRGDAAKFVALRGSDADALRMMTLVRDAAGRLAGHVASTAFTRLASAALGAPFVYAAIQPGGRIAVPMPTATHMCRRCEFRRVRPGTPLFVLLGGDVEAAVSTDMLQVMFGLAGMPVVAARWSCSDPEPAIEAIRRFGWAGAAVTIPHKVVVHDWLDRDGALDATARACGSVNTVVSRDGRLRGHNTDLGGLADALAPHAAPDGPILVLGGGGAARAAVALARERGAEPVVFARDPSAAAALGARVAPDAAAALAARPAIIVNATPSGPPGGAPFLDPSGLLGRAVVLDMQVFARPTALLAAAARAGHATVPGLDMLGAQAVRQVRLLGGEVPEPAAAWCANVARSLLRRRDAPIVLTGLRCAGKTTVGEILARVLGRRFLDTDRETERRAGRTVESMLRAGDEAAFRAIERDVLRDAIDVPGAVVACGGGAALHDAEFGALAAWGFVVLLDAPDDVLLARRAASPRAPLTTLPPADELAGQRRARMSVYERAAGLVVDVASLAPDAAADFVAAWWDALPA